MYLSGIAMVRGRLGLRVERDLHFTARKPLSAYARDAQPEPAADHRDPAEVHRAGSRMTEACPCMQTASSPTG